MEYIFKTVLLDCHFIQIKAAFNKLFNKFWPYLGVAVDGNNKLKTAGFFFVQFITETEATFGIDSASFFASSAFPPPRVTNTDDDVPTLFLSASIELSATTFPPEMMMARLQIVSTSLKI